MARPRKPKPPAKSPKRPRKAVQLGAKSKAVKSASDAKDLVQRAWSSTLPVLRPLLTLPGGLRTMSNAMKVALPLLVLALGAVSYAGLKATRPDVPSRPAQEKVWPVLAAPVTFSDFKPEVRLYGETVAGRVVELRALVAGQVIETGPGLRSGGLVKKGDLLLRIDPFQYQGALVEAEAQLMEAKAELVEIEATLKSEQDALGHSKEQLEIAERDLARAEPLVQRGVVSKKVADDRRMIVSERNQAVKLRVNNLVVQGAKAEQQQAKIAQLDWKVRQAKRHLEETELKAPFDAYVKSVSAELGRLLGVNDAVATLLDRDWMDARFTLSDRQYGRIVTEGENVIGRPIEVLWRVGDRELAYQAVIERVAAEITSESGGVEVYARLTDPQKPIPIRAGAFVEVQVFDRAYSNVARLPETALYEGDRVYVIADGRLSERKVDLIGSAGDDVLVRGAIAEGDRVVTTKLTSAGEGLAVEEKTAP